MVSNLGELAERLNMTAISVTDDKVIMTMPVEGNRQPAGLMHGGANAALVEEAASVLAIQRAPQGKIPVGTELNVSQLRGAKKGLVTATATVLAQARSSICSQVVIRDESGEHTAVGRMTNVFIS
ncbi:MAG: PaaI family thioesterase [Ancrocorticia sp.]|nr:PaaI family thioesterase [Ancrocorticia sp.]